MTASTQLLIWLNGVATGGPNSDGRYPLTGSDGVTHLILCPAAQALNPTVDPSPIDAYVASAAADAAIAHDAKLKAAEWANKAEDSVVESGMFSAFHWAKKAQYYAANPTGVDLSNYYTKTASDSLYRAKATAITYAELSGKPTTVAAAGLTDALKTNAAFADAFSSTPSYYNGTTLAIDCNNLAIGSKALVQGGAGNTNEPQESGLWYIETVATYDTVSKLQRAYPYNFTNGVIYAVRTFQGGTWTPWAYAYDSYTKTQIDSALAGKASLAGNRFTAQQTVFTDYALTAYGAAGASPGYDMAFVGAWSNAGIWRVWNSATDHTGYGEMAITAANGPKWNGSAMWHAGNFNPSDKASLNTGVQFANVTTGVVGSGNGYTITYQGSGATPGYLGFFSGDGTRRGYVGWSSGSNELMLSGENSWGWRCNSTFTVDGVLTVNNQVKARGASSGVWTDDRTDSSRFFGMYSQYNIGYLYSSVHSNIMSLGSEIHSMKSHYFDNGNNYTLSANAAAWVRNPRVFVQSTDPGAQAQDGDLWFW